MARVNYLNNRDICIEIHKSKNTYSYYIDPKYNMFDIIVNELPEITEDFILQLKQDRSARLTKDKVKAQKELKIPTKKIDSTPIDIETFDVDDLVIRLNTYEHIPTSDRVNVPKKTSDYYVQLNFPPFKHYTIIKNDNGYEYQEVGRSHWKDGLHNGEFCKEHGKMTNKLGRMIERLVKKFASKGCYCNYSYNDEMQSQAVMQLCDVGLKFDESRQEIPNPFAYYTTISRNAFNKILNAEKKSQMIRDDLLVQSGSNPSMTRQTEDEMESSEYYTNNVPLSKKNEESDD